ncbi:MAG UNVERIFIED_CONTAM: hypothetical protein LVR29_23820 [Microcystis novacekii LVE1205-3]|jgi:hypothetical protein
MIIEGGFQFDFNIINLSRRFFIDPDVAVHGYSYIVDSGPNMTSSAFYPRVSVMVSMNCGQILSGREL